MQDLAEPLGDPMCILELQNASRVQITGAESRACPPRIPSWAMFWALYIRMAHREH